MANSPAAPNSPPDQQDTGLGLGRLIVLSVLAAALAVCIGFSLATRDVMEHLPASGRGQSAALNVRSGHVDQSPWQTIQALAPLAVTSEEAEYVRQAERLADHAVDQAFAAALRETTLAAQSSKLSGDALALSERIHQLEQVVKQDQANVQQLTAAEKQNPASAQADDQKDGSDLDIAKAQLRLDSDELTDATQDLARATGDQRPQIQSELAEREAAMKKFDSESGSTWGQTAVASASRYATLAGRIGAWLHQNSRMRLIAQAMQQTQDDVRALTEKHITLEAQVNTPSPDKGDRTARLQQLNINSTMRQLLSIYDDRIQTEQRLVGVYERWSDQVRLQHRIIFHLILQSCVWLVLVLIAMIIGDAIVRRILNYPALERRQRHTLRAILQLSIQLVGALILLLIIFGAPHQTPTILGLTTAALTIALQDFILAFFGWFVLMGKKGIRIGDTVEINGVGGEVIEIGLTSTTLLETGTLAEKGYATGRRITFLNNFAIRGQYFNFSTSGQWMLDHFEVTVPASDRMAQIVDAILNAVEQVTGENTRIAEQEWRRVTRGENVKALNASPSVNVRPAGNDFGVEVRYVTRASDRVDTRNRLYRRVVELLHQPQASA